MKQRGFTLIELSIVLVILGLIVGGVVGGRALVHQAELQGIVRESNSLKTAVNTFYTQFNALPGDFKEASQYWAGATDGDGSGGWGKAVWAPFHEVMEGFPAYDHLNKAEILPNSLNGQYDNAVPGVNIYASKLKGAGWQFSGDWTNKLFNEYAGQFIRLATTESSNAWLQGGAVIAKDARTIDLKIDDGNPGTGTFLAAPGAEDSAAGNCVSKAGGDTLPVSYVLSDTTHECSLVFIYRK